MIRARKSLLSAAGNRAGFMTSSGSPPQPGEKRFPNWTWTRSQGKIKVDRHQPESHTAALEHAWRLADAVVANASQAMSVMALAVTFLSIPQHLHGQIIDAWKRDGRRPLKQFSPYAAHVVTVELYFQFGLAAHLIASNRPSNRTDIAYLFYLPFCTLFVSSDKLHKRTAPQFLRADQEFVWGPDLKVGLKTVNAHFLQVPEDQREKGIMSFADVPPDGNMVADLWDRHMRKGVRSEKLEDAERNPEADAELIKKFKEFRAQQTEQPDPSEPWEEDMISISRSVNRKRGSWWQVPKDMPDTDD